MSEPLLQIQNVSKNFGGKARLLSGRTPLIQAVRNVSLDLGRGGALGVVGETGCGKSTLARMIMGIIPPTSGRILYKGKEISVGTQADRQELYRTIQFVFQDPMSSLNPRKTIRQILETPMIRLLSLSKKEREKRLLTLMETVNLRPEYLDRHPHEFSGGQAQRIGIARALAPKPEVLILDEPVSALDVSIQAQILKLLRDLQSRLGLTYLFISHDLAVVDYLCDSIAVMYLGTVTEYGTAPDVFTSPRHPYTHVLLASVPEPGARSAVAVKLTGELPAPSNPPPGCPFSSRCYRVENICRSQRPPLESFGDTHKAACFFADTPVPPPVLDHTGDTR
jgi:oligopeptide/dipeptide ABC transporter ATP-binding protein